jgi:hypothetical protein
MEENVLLAMSLAGLGMTVVFIVFVNLFDSRSGKKRAKLPNSKDIKFPKFMRKNVI